MLLLKHWFHLFRVKSFPNHYTHLWTDLYPGNHGPVDNEFYDPAQKNSIKQKTAQWWRIHLLRRCTAVAVAKQQGMKSSFIGRIGGENSRHIPGLLLPLWCRDEERRTGRSNYPVVAGSGTTTFYLASIFRFCRSWKHTSGPLQRPRNGFFTQPIHFGHVD